MPDHQDFMRAICADPAADAPRLIFADWLEEQGEGERSEFIRVQCELANLPLCTHGTSATLRATWVNEGCHACRLRERERKLLDANRAAWFSEVHRLSVESGVGIGLPTLKYEVRRGFIASVSLTCANWVGGRCEKCNGSRGKYQYAEPLNRGMEGEHWYPCPECHGHGELPGHGPAICAAQPIEVVRLADVRPSTTDREPGFRDFYCWPYTQALANRLGGIAEFMWWGHDSWRDTEEECMAILSAAAIAWAKAQNERSVMFPCA